MYYEKKNSDDLFFEEIEEKFTDLLPEHNFSFKILQIQMT